MPIKRILNYTLKFKGFVFEKSYFGKESRGHPSIEIKIVPRKGSKAIDQFIFMVFSDVVKAIKLARSS